MTVKDLYNVSPQNHIFIVRGNNADEYRGEKDFEGLTKTEYNGEKYGNDLIVDRIIATTYPMYEHVIEVIYK